MTAYFKLLALILSSGFIINLQDWRSQIIITLALILFLRQKIFSRLKYLIIVFGLIIVIQLFAGDIFQGIAAGLKIVNVSLAALTYTTFTSVREITQTWNFLGKKGSLLITLTFNLIPIILKEAKDISLIQNSRGRKLITPFPVIVPLLHRTLRRAEQLALVLELKKSFF